MEKEYYALMNDYISAKPLLNDVYKRNGGVFPDAILNEIRAINDHVSRIFDDNRDDEKKHDEIVKAKGHLNRMVYDAYKQLNIFFFDYMNRFEEENFGTHWFHIKKGEVWRQYIESRDKIVDYVKNAKCNESVCMEDAMEWYAKAYTEQRYTYKLIEDNYDNLVLSKWKKFLDKLNSQKGWLVSTIVLAIVPALIWELIMHFSQITSFVNKWLAGVFHSFCEWGLNL